jgi:hypothetical protein
MQPERAGRVRCGAWLGVAAEPVRETRWAEARIVAGRWALVVHCRAEIWMLGCPLQQLARNQGMADDCHRHQHNR